MKNAGVVGATMAWVASSGGVDGVDGVVGGLVAWSRRWRRWLASIVDGGSPSVSPVVRMARTAVACSLFEQNAGCQWRFCPLLCDSLLHLA